MITQPEPSGKAWAGHYPQPAPSRIELFFAQHVTAA
jgi:hypothetical protein